MSAARPLTYFSSWFCPFAHRTTIALHHHADVLRWDWEEALGWTSNPDGTEDLDADERADWWYHHKSPGLLRANPKGMIPTFEDPATGRAVTDSIVCLEFLDELAREAKGSAGSLLPEDPFERARARSAATRMDRSVCSLYYRVLGREDPAEKREAFEDLVQALGEFADDLDEARGPFWGGSGHPGLVDMVLFPHAWRLFALQHYFGDDFAVGEDDDAGRRYAGWLRNMEETACVATTLPDKDRYIQHVKKYASGKARSKIGNAVRRGVAAHDYDHEVDGDEDDASAAAESQQQQQ